MSEDMPQKEFSFEELLETNKLQVAIVFIGVMILGIGVFILKNDMSKGGEEIHVLEAATESENSMGKVVVEVSGEVKNPGVYELDVKSRIQDALVAAGGLTDEADHDWIERFLNKAQIVSDAQKIYIPKIGENQNATDETQEISGQNTAMGDKVNINTSSASELEALWGIGQVTAQNIIEGRPYSSVEELLKRKIIKQNVYERNKDILVTY